MPRVMIPTSDQTDSWLELAAQGNDPAHFGQDVCVWFAGAML